jgi:hypothetical protein
MKGKFFKGSCGSDGLWIEYDRDFGTEISLFPCDPQNLSWGNRVSMAWACLKGETYGDEVVFCNQQIADLTEHLLEIQNYYE